jgi:CRP/FNR family cyclic AMP-dependent transcriptional regulator
MTRNKDVLRLAPFETVFTQGDRCNGVMYIERGRVRLTVTARGSATRVVGELPAGSFFGEGALARQCRRKSTAETMVASTIRVLKTAEMRRQLHDDEKVAEWFRRHLLARNARLESDLVMHMFNGCEKRLASSLLLLAHFDEHQLPRYALPKISRDLLAEMSGNTRSKVDSLMNAFRKAGYIERHRERDGGVQIHRSMLSVVLQS